MEAWLDKVMVEHTCPDCNGARVRATRLLFTIGGKTIHDVGQLNFDELQAFLAGIKPAGRGADAGRQVLTEIRGRLNLLLGHRPRLPELQPALRHAVRRRVAAHPAVHADRIRADGHALRPRRAEHRPASQGQRQDDRDARKPARHRQHRHRGGARRGHHPRRRPRRRDGPRPGCSRRRAWWCRGRSTMCSSARRRRPASSFRASAAIAVPARRRPGSGKSDSSSAAPARTTSRTWTWRSRSARSSAITGASGSGKSTLVNDILYKALWKRLEDTRTLPGEHDRGRGGGARPQGRQHRSVADRPEQPIEPGDLHRLLRHHPRSVHQRAAVDRARTTSRADSASTSREGAARSARAKG